MKISLINNLKDDIVAKADIIVGNDGKVCDIIFDKEISLLL